MTRELEKLQRDRKKARYAGYFAVLLIMIVLTDILDNLATNVGANITSSFITEFFVNGKVFGRSYGYEEGLALHNTISLFGYVLALLAPFYKSLADRVGRKPLFVISALGMAAGLLIIFLCRSYPVFLVGSFMLSFFIGSIGLLFSAWIKRSVPATLCTYIVLLGMCILPLVIARLIPDVVGPGGSRSASFLHTLALLLNPLLSTYKSLSCPHLLVAAVIVTATLFNVHNSGVARLAFALTVREPFVHFLRAGRLTDCPSTTLSVR